MKSGLGIGARFFAAAGFLAGLFTAGAAVVSFVRPRKYPPYAPAQPAPAEGLAPGAPSYHPPRPAAPGTRAEAAGMTRFVAALVVFAVVATVAGLVGMARATRSQNRQEAIALTGGDPDRGRSAIQIYGCASCHTIPGVRGANAQVGPPLTQLGGRAYVAGVLPNTPDNLVRWLLDPPAVDPMTAMPNLHVTEDDARDIACYLYTLR